MKSKFIAAIVVAMAHLLATAQTADSSPVKFVIPYAAGGNVDSTARIIAPGMSKALGRPVIIENKPGAGGLIAGEYVARAKADGLTLLLTSNGPILHSPIIYGRPVYDWKKDFIPVGPVTLTPMVLLASTSSRFATLADVLGAAKRSPGEVSFATPGSGSTNHLVGLLLEKEANVRFNFIQYKGTAPAMADLLGGHAQLGIDQLAPAIPQLNKGTLQGIAVTSAERLPAMPNVPTFKELGIPRLQASSFVGVFAPAGTSAETVASLAAALAKVLADKQIAARFEQLGATVHQQSSTQFAAFLHDEDATWLPLIKNASIKAE